MDQQQPTPQQWLKENQGKSLYDYYLAYPQPVEIPEKPQYIIEKEERRENKFTNFWLYPMILIGLTCIWWTPRYFEPYALAGFLLFLFWVIRNENIIQRVIGISEQSTYFKKALISALSFLSLAALINVFVMLMTNKTMVILFNGHSTAQNFSFDKEQRTLQPNDEWVIECGDGRHKLINPATNLVEKMYLEQGFHVFGYGDKHKLQVKEIVYKSRDEMTSGERLSFDLALPNFSSDKPSVPVNGHYVFKHSKINKVYLPNEQPPSSYWKKKGNDTKHFKLN